MPDIHDRYAGVGGCYVVDSKGVRVPEPAKPKGVTAPKSIATDTEAQVDADQK